MVSSSIRAYARPCLFFVLFYHLSYVAARTNFDLRDTARSPAELVAQTSATCLPEFFWMQNKKAQTPCLVAAFLQGACHSGDWNIPALEPGKRYDPPNSTTADPCSCSWAAYNLLSACSICQGDQYATAVTNWDPFKIACGNFLSVSTYFPATITLPDQTSIPYWAGTNPNTWNNHHFDVVQARALSNANHADLNPNGAAQKSSKPPIGAIAGGVIGGLALIALVTAFITFRCLKHRSTSGDPTLRPFSWTSRNKSSGVQSIHGRSFSDLSGTYITTPLPHQVSGTLSPQMQSSSHTLPYAGPPLPGGAAPSLPAQPLPMFTTASPMRPERLIIPFTSAEPTPGAGRPPHSRKLSEMSELSLATTANSSTGAGGPYPQLEEVAPSESIYSTATRPRLNPPAYTVTPDGVPNAFSPTSPTGSPPESPTPYSSARPRGHRKKGSSVDTGNSLPSGENDSDALMARMGIPPPQRTRTPNANDRSLRLVSPRGTSATDDSH